MSATKTVTVHGIDLVLSWEPDTGATVTLPSDTLTRKALAELCGASSLIDDTACQFDAEQRIQPFDLAAHGMRHFNFLDVRGMNTSPPPGARFGFWMAIDPSEMDLGTPFVCAVISHKMSEEGAHYEEVEWHLGNVGFPTDEGDVVSINLPHADVMAKLIGHLTQDAESAQVGIYLESPETMNEARFLWDANVAQEEFESSITKADHVPYTRVARVARGANQAYASVTVYAFDVETEAGVLVTPAVAVEVFGNNWNAVQSALEADGFTLVDPIYLTPSNNGVVRWRQKKVFVKNVERFESDEARKWLGCLVEMASSYSSRGQFRTA